MLRCNVSLIRRKKKDLFANVETRLVDTEKKMDLKE